jgi:hypothetical protein
MAQVRARLVHRQRDGAVARDAGLVAQRGGDRLPERERDVLRRVMAVDFDVPFSADGQVDQPVLGDLLEHVGEEGDRRLYVPSAVAVQTDGDVDLRFFRRALLAGSPHGGHSTTPDFVLQSLRTVP